MRRSKRRIGDDVRMSDDEEEGLNRRYGVEEAEFVRPSATEPAKTPESTEERSGGDECRGVRSCYQVELQCSPRAVRLAAGLGASAREGRAEEGVEPSQGRGFSHAQRQRGAYKPPLRRRRS